MSEALPADRRGVVRPERIRFMLPQTPVRPPPPTPDPEAYQLAMANRHKPWARRYLRKFMGSFYR